MAPTTRSKAANKPKTKASPSVQRKNLSKSKVKKPKTKSAAPSKTKAPSTKAQKKSAPSKTKAQPNNVQKNKPADATKAKPTKVQKKTTPTQAQPASRPANANWRARRRKNLRRGLRDGFEYEEAYKAFPGLFRIIRRSSTPSAGRPSRYMDSALTSPVPRSPPSVARSSTLVPRSPSTPFYGPRSPPYVPRKPSTPSYEPRSLPFVPRRPSTPSSVTRSLPIPSYAPRSPPTPSPSPSVKTPGRRDGGVRPSSAASSPGILLGAMKSPSDRLAAMGFRSPGVRFATPSVPTSTLAARKARFSASTDSRRSSTSTATIPAALTAPRARRVSSIARDIAENPRVAALRNETTLSSTDLVDIGNALREIQADVDDLIETVRSKVRIMDVVGRSRARRRDAAMQRD